MTLPGLVDKELSENYAAGDTTVNKHPGETAQTPSDVPGQLRRGFVEGREFGFDGFSIWFAGR